MIYKILHLIPSLMSGGTERQLVNIVTNSSKNDFAHYICTIGDGNFFAEELDAQDIQVQMLNLKKKRAWFSGAKKFGSFARLVKPNLINSWLYEANITSRIAKILYKSRVPLLTSLQSTDYEPETIKAGNWSPRKVEALKTIDKFSIKLTNPYFAACSAVVKKSFERQLKLDSRRIKVIFNSVDPDVLSVSEKNIRAVREEFGISDQAFIYLNVGRMDAGKNQRFLLQEFVEVLKSIPQARLIIIGTGPLEAELKTEANQLNIDKNVIFTGRRKDVGTFLDLADVFVFPTLFEGLPLSLVEAMFKAKPSISSDIEVIREVVSHKKDGLLVEPNKPGAFAEAMKYLHKNSEFRLLMGKNALSKADKIFHIKKTISEWDDYYDEIISKTVK